MTKLIATPVNTTGYLSPNSTGFRARQDYYREREHFLANSLMPACWDDSRYNKANVGDMFSFVNNKTNKMEIFRIIAINDSTTRPDYWNIRRHSRRNVLTLSNKLYELNFDEYKKNTDIKKITKFKELVISSGLNKKYKIQETCGINKH